MSLQARVTGAAVERAAERLGERDWQIMAELQRLRVATAVQLERLCFRDLAGVHRDRSRRRALARLVSLGVLATLNRRIGGVRAGSSGLVFTLDVLGVRLVQSRGAHQQSDGAGRVRSRHPTTPTERFLRHSLAVSELYVELVEAAHAPSGLSLLRFDAEPACWWPDSFGGLVKPDGLLVLATADVADAWALEVDRATESLPTLRRQFARYLELLERGEGGPTGPLPRVLVTVPDDKRLSAVQAVVQAMPDSAHGLIHSSRQDTAVRYLLDRLYE